MDTPYAYPVFCVVYLLRFRGTWLGRSQVVEANPFRGILDFRRVAPEARHRFGAQAMVARLLDPRRLEHSLTHDLHWAKVVQIKEGGVMIEGTELLFKGAKSAAIRCVQTWWCIVDREEGFAALDRMRAPGVTTGFHPNDD